MLPVLSERYVPVVESALDEDLEPPSLVDSALDEDLDPQRYVPVHTSLSTYQYVQVHTSMY